jgi:ADP-ribosylglycohydrolase
MREKTTVDSIPSVFFGQNEDSGNGSIMRLSPVPIMYHANPEIAKKVGALQSRGTHPGEDAAVACVFMTHFMVSAINFGLPKSVSQKGHTPVQTFIADVISNFYQQHSEEEQGRNPSYTRLFRLLRSQEPPESPEVCWNWKEEQLPIACAIINRRKKSTYNGYPILLDYWGAYSFDGLAMAMWALSHSTSFAETLVKTVNLLGDADSTGAIASQMAGALYGYKSITSDGDRPKTLQQSANVSASTISFDTMGDCWLSHLRRWDPHYEIELRAVLVYHSTPKSSSAEVESNAKAMPVFAEFENSAHTDSNALISSKLWGRVGQLCFRFIILSLICIVLHLFFQM